MSRRTRALKISKKTRETVYERDKGLCVLCGSQGVPNAHFVPRSKGGLGIEQNIVTLCLECHHRLDNTAERGRLLNEVAEYLQKLYPHFDHKRRYYGSKL